MKGYVFLHEIHFVVHSRLGWRDASDRISKATSISEIDLVTHLQYHQRLDVHLIFARGEIQFPFT